jgi:hypothetical protein
VRGSFLHLSSIFHLTISFAKDTTHWWIVHFAPSTAGFVTPVLKNYFHLPRIGPDLTQNSEDLLPTRIAAIGPTTHAYLIEQLHLQVHAMAQAHTAGPAFLSGEF